MIMKVLLWQIWRMSRKPLIILLLLFLLPVLVPVGLMVALVATPLAFLFIPLYFLRGLLEEQTMIVSYISVCRFSWDFWVVWSHWWRQWWLGSQENAPLECSGLRTEENLVDSAEDSGFGGADCGKRQGLFMGLNEDRIFSDDQTVKSLQGENSVDPGEVHGFGGVDCGKKEGLVMVLNEDNIISDHQTVNTVQRENSVDPGGYHGFGVLHCGQKIGLLMSLNEGKVISDEHVDQTVTRQNSVDPGEDHGFGVLDCGQKEGLLMGLNDNKVISDEDVAQIVKTVRTFCLIEEERNDTIACQVGGKGEICTIKIVDSVEDRGLGGMAIAPLDCRQHQGLVIGLSEDKVLINGEDVVGGKGKNCARKTGDQVEDHGIEDSANAAPDRGKDKDLLMGLNEDNVISNEDADRTEKTMCFIEKDCTGQKPEPVVCQEDVQEENCSRNTCDQVEDHGLGVLALGYDQPTGLVMGLNADKVISDQDVDQIVKTISFFKQDRASLKPDPIACKGDGDLEINAKTTVAQLDDHGLDGSATAAVDCGQVRCVVMGLNEDEIISDEDADQTVKTISFIEDLQTPGWNQKAGDMILATDDTSRQLELEVVQAESSSSDLDENGTALGEIVNEVMGYMKPHGEKLEETVIVVGCSDSGRAQGVPLDNAKGRDHPFGLDDIEQGIGECDDRPAATTTFGEAEQLHSWDQKAVVVGDGGNGEAQISSLDPAQERCPLLEHVIFEGRDQAAVFLSFLDDEDSQMGTISGSETGENNISAAHDVLRGEYMEFTPSEAPSCTNLIADLNGLATEDESCSNGWHQTSEKPLDKKATGRGEEDVGNMTLEASCVNLISDLGGPAIVDKFCSNGWHQGSKMPLDEKKVGWGKEDLEGRTLEAMAMPPNIKAAAQLLGGRGVQMQMSSLFAAGHASTGIGNDQLIVGFSDNASQTSALCNIALESPEHTLPSASAVTVLASQAEKFMDGTERRGNFHNSSLPESSSNEEKHLNACFQNGFKEEAHVQESICDTSVLNSKFAGSMTEEISVNLPQDDSVLVIPSGNFRENFVESPVISTLAESEQQEASTQDLDAIIASPIDDRSVSKPKRATSPTSVSCRSALDDSLVHNVSDSEHCSAFISDTSDQISPKEVGQKAALGQEKDAEIDLADWNEKSCPGRRDKVDFRDWNEKSCPDGRDTIILCTYEPKEQKQQEHHSIHEHFKVTNLPLEITNTCQNMIPLCSGVEDEHVYSQADAELNDIASPSIQIMQENISLPSSLKITGQEGGHVDMINTLSYVQSTPQKPEDQIISHKQEQELPMQQALKVDKLLETECYPETHELLPSSPNKTKSEVMGDNKEHEISSKLEDEDSNNQTAKVFEEKQMEQLQSEVIAIKKILMGDNKLSTGNLIMEVENLYKLVGIQSPHSLDASEDVEQIACILQPLKDVIGIQ